MVAFIPSIIAVRRTTPPNSIAHLPALSSPRHRHWLAYSLPQPRHHRCTTTPLSLKNPLRNTVSLSVDHDSGNSSNNNNNNNNNNNRTNLISFFGDDNPEDNNNNNKANRNGRLLLHALVSPIFLIGSNLSRSSSRSRSLMPKRLYISHVILGINIVMFIIQSTFLPELLMNFAKINSAIAMGQYYRLLTPVFVHASTTHLLVNSFSLNSTGPSVESWFGKRRFLFLYAFSGLCGNILSYLCTPSPAVGASGAIFGLVGASAVMLARHNRLLGRRASRGLQSLVYVVLTNFALGLTPGSRIDNFGHLGGFLGGILYSYLFGPSLKLRYSRSSRRPIIYDEPVVVQVQKDIQKRLKQLSRLLQN